MYLQIVGWIFSWAVLNAGAAEFSYYNCQGDNFELPVGERKVELALVLSPDHASITDSQGIHLSLPRVKRPSDRRTRAASYEVKSLDTEAYAKATLPLRVADQTRISRKSFLLVYQLDQKNFQGEFVSTAVRANCRSQR